MKTEETIRVTVAVKIRYENRASRKDALRDLRQNLGCAGSAIGSFDNGQTCNWFYETGRVTGPAKDTP